ncbi:hypothetical protein [Streptomyces sp. TBY4]|uniref:hypothetical protein n=1 Tax=Streptomyces sp. TBY4 TaxID=2962030 RepID=UPI0020B65CCF|nr:hypothetical protein [Streptomyces sp. TBY4]MCP3757977.1 hypothetical protein [Streptomyces sp. TBY4]
MNRSALLAATALGLALCTITPATASAAPQTETVTSCGNSGLQAGLATRVCADITGTTVTFHGRVALAGPPSPGSPQPQARELLTTLTVEILGAAPPQTQFRPALFTGAALVVGAPAVTAPCGATVRGTFGVASYPHAARPVVHEVTLSC